MIFIDLNYHSTVLNCQWVNFHALSDIIRHFYLIINFKHKPPFSLFSLIFSEMNKMRVVILRGHGKLWNQIHKETGIVCPPVRLICLKIQQSGSVENQLSSGRPPKLRTRDVRN